MTRVHKGTQSASEHEQTGTFASVFISAKAKRVKVFRCSATVQKTRIFCAQGAHHKWYSQDRMVGHTQSMPLLK